MLTDKEAMADIDVLVISELRAYSDKPPWLITLARTLGWGGACLQATPQQREQSSWEWRDGHPVEKAAGSSFHL